MISFRYHLVSIVAVFAALAVGIIAGSTAVKQSLVDSTEQNLERTERQLAEISEERDEFEAALGGYEEFSAAASESLLNGRLDGVALVVLDGTAIDGAVRTGIDEAIEIGGARVVGRIRLDDSIGDDDAALRIAGALDSSARDEPQLRAELGRAVGRSIGEFGAAAAASVRRAEAAEERSTTTTTSVPASTQAPVAATAGVTATVATDPVAPLDSAATGSTADTVPGAAAAAEPSSSVPATTTTTVPLEIDPGVWLGAGRIEALDGANLLRVEESGDEFVPSSPLVLLVIVDRRSAVPVHDIVAATLVELGRSDVAVVVAEAGSLPSDDGSKSDSVVSIVRADGELRDDVSTVDDVEVVAGWFGVVLAIEERVGGRVGHYGRHDGSRGLLPVPS